MKIIFTITAHNFKRASEIEQMLRAQGITHNAGYTVEVESDSALKALPKPKRKKMKIDKSHIAVVAKCIADHPDWIHKQISEHTGVSRATVSRIAIGKHKLQLNGDI